MEWKKEKNYLIARGGFGFFKIRKKAGMYYCSYASKDKNKVFMLPPKRSLAEIKYLAQTNYYWEEKEETQEAG